MKLITTLLSVTLLSGCSVFNVKPKWPKAPDISECPELTLVAEGTTKLSDTLYVITENYGKYNICKARVEAWQQWYSEQKKIYEEK